MEGQFSSLEMRLWEFTTIHGILEISTYPSCKTFTSLEMKTINGFLERFTVWKQAKSTL